MRPASACRELVQLRPQDLHLDAGYLTTTGKGRKQRIVPIGDEAAQWVDALRREARPAPARHAQRRRDSSSMRAAAAPASPASASGRS